VFPLTLRKNLSHILGIIFQGEATMLRSAHSTLLVGVCLLLLASYSSAETDDVELLFVQSATSGSFDGTTLTLGGIASTSYFSDRPNRIAGQMGTDTFVGQWAEGKDSFKSDPPNAVLSVLGESGASDSVVELSNPKLEGGQLSYQVKVLDGKPPARFKTASLFIDGSSAGAFVGGMVAGHVLHNVHQNTEFRRQMEGG
jgi:hypothetical protein